MQRFINLSRERTEALFPCYVRANRQELLEWTQHLFQLFIVATIKGHGDNDVWLPGEMPDQNVPARQEPRLQGRLMLTRQRDKL